MQNSPPPQVQDGSHFLLLLSFDRASSKNEFYSSCTKGSPIHLYTFVSQNKKDCDEILSKKLAKRDHG